MGARATRQGVNRWNREHGFWRTRDGQTFNEGAAREQQIAPVAAAPEQPFQRIAHPVVEQPRYTTEYRVTRQFKTRDGLQTELIGETKTEREALDIARRETWAAFVTDRNGRQVHFNWRPMETRA